MQAETQLLAILAHRELRDIRVYSRTQANRDAFIDRLKNVVELQPYDDCEQAVAGAEIVILATNSCSAVLDVRWLKDAMHISTVGPKFKDAHELPLELLDDGVLLVCWSVWNRSDHPQRRNRLLGNVKFRL